MENSPAHNASFERVCLSRLVYGSAPNRFLDPAQWQCTMVHAAMLGLPYAFASHFAPTQMDAAIKLYRDRFSIGPYGFIALAQDPDGNMFGIHSTQ